MSDRATVEDASTPRETAGEGGAALQSVPSVGTSSSRERLRRILRVARIATVAVLLAGATIFFLDFVSKHYAIKDWLFWIYLKAWAVSAFFGVACVAAGNACLVRVLGRTLPLVEHFVASFAVGAFAFFIALYGLGIVGALQPWVFFAVPIVLTAAGFVDGRRVLGRALRHISAARRKRPAGWSLLDIAVLMAGTVALIVIYGPVLTPDNVAYDVRWYHIPLAEHYVAEHAIRRFPEGWFFGAYPHMASIYYAWALLVPASTYFDKVMICAHIEVIFFLMTLAGVPALVRVLMPGVRAHLSWVTVFLFPEIFAYDSALHAGADHVAAFWTIPLLTFLLRGLRQRSPKLLGLFSLMAAGALNTKFTAISAVIFPVIGATVACLYRACAGPKRQDRLTAVYCLLACAAVGLVATTPFWLKNLIWYGDPLYPKFASQLHARPASPDYRIPFENWFYAPGFRAAPGWKGITDGLQTMATFSFVPNDWPGYHGTAPVFGSLFSLLLVAVPFIGRRPRLWFAIVATHVGVFAWYQIHHFDRYLQTLLPWMAACTTVCIIALWGMHWVVRIPLVALVAAQVVWGGDAPFLGTHAMAGSAMTRTLELLQGGLKGDGAKRFRRFGSSYEVGRHLPANAKVLVHEQHIHWGLEKASISDWQGSQAGLSYVRDGSIARMYDTLRSMGVTHLMWVSGQSRGGDTIGSDLLFFRFANYAAKNLKHYGELTVARMPSSRPSDDSTDASVAMFDCGNRYPTGVYRLTRLVKSDFDPDRTYPRPDEPLSDSLDATAAAALLHRVEYAVINSACHGREAGLATSAGLVYQATRADLGLYARPE